MNPGKGYQQAPTVTITGGGGSSATAIAVLNDLVSQVNWHILLLDGLLLAL